MSIVKSFRRDFKADPMRGIMIILVIIVVILVFIGNIGLEIAKFMRGPTPEQIADSYCHANGYAKSTNHDFKTNTFFVNCTQTITETCASNQECIHKNGVMNE